MDSLGRVGLSVGGVGSILHEGGLDELSWDDCFSSSNDEGVADDIS
jgi:hypothetical protein